MESYKQYITVQEAAQKLGRSEAEVLRMLETGALSAMLPAELKSKDGSSISFDYALLPAEAVRRVLHHGGDSFTLEWPYAFGNGYAVCEGANLESLRLLRCGELLELLPVNDSEMEPAREPRILKSQGQDKAILDQIVNMGHDPLSFPKWQPNKKGIKAAVRDALVGVHPLFPRGGKQFDIAWERLRRNKAIVDKA